MGGRTEVQTAFVGQNHDITACCCCSSSRVSESLTGLDPSGGSGLMKNETETKKILERKAELHL